MAKSQLIDQMRDSIRRKHYSIRTEEALGLGEKIHLLS